jgi:hypothetical protein
MLHLSRPQLTVSFKTATTTFSIFKLLSIRYNVWSSIYYQKILRQKEANSIGMFDEH